MKQKKIRIRQLIFYFVAFFMAGCQMNKTKDVESVNFERVNTCINAYSNTAMMHSAVIAALMGEVKMTGQSPVDINIENFTKK
jgi:hypothetical protein